MGEREVPDPYQRLVRWIPIVVPLAAAVLVTAASTVLLAQPLTLFHLVALLLVVGIGSNYALFFDHLRASIPRWSINPRAHEVPLLPARYGADSGIAGAASLV